jgi:hypothetical protein
VTSDPKRLTVVGATDLERTLLHAARRERPSPELTARMAAGLGLSAAGAVTGAAPAAAAAPVAAAKASVAVWVSAGVLAAAVGAGVVGVRLSSAPAPAAHADRPAPAVAAPRVEDPVVAAPAVTERRIEKVKKRPAAPAHVHAQAGDLRDQIALIDAARTAVKARSTERALALLHRYDATFPGGAFRPEALALRIEALDEAGRAPEARGLARDFLARYPESPLAARVAKIARR